LPTKKSEAHKDGLGDGEGLGTGLGDGEGTGDGIGLTTGLGAAIGLAILSAIVGLTVSLQAVSIIIKQNIPSFAMSLTASAACFLSPVFFNTARYNFRYKFTFSKAS